MSWTVSNPVSVGLATKKSHYDALWDNCDFFKIQHGTDGTHGAVTATSLASSSITPSNLAASLPVFSDGSKKLVSLSIADTLTALGFDGWVDYTASSSYSGWSVFSAKSVKYLKLGSIVFVNFTISGTSDSDAASFTIPDATDDIITVPIYAADNGIKLSGFANRGSGTSTMNLYPGGDPVSGGYWLTWTASGGKDVAGHFFYEIR